MATETVTFQIDSEAAQAFRRASTEEREKLAALLSAWLREYARSDKTSLKRVMDGIAEKAQRRGLTPEILDDILRDE